MSLKEVDNERDSTGSASGLDVTEDIQDELCKIWDMSMNVV